MKNELIAIEETLRPCPFCGTAPEISIVHDSYPGPVFLYIDCPNCKVEMRSDKDITFANEVEQSLQAKKLATKWNKRK